MKNMLLAISIGSLLGTAQIGQAARVVRLNHKKGEKISTHENKIPKLAEVVGLILNKKVEIDGTNWSEVGGNPRKGNTGGSLTFRRVGEKVVLDQIRDRSDMPILTIDSSDIDADTNEIVRNDFAGHPIYVKITKRQKVSTESKDVIRATKKEKGLFGSEEKDVQNMVSKLVDEPVTIAGNSKHLISRDKTVDLNWRLFANKGWLPMEVFVNGVPYWKLKDAEFLYGHTGAVVGANLNGVNGKTTSFFADEVFGKKTQPTVFTGPSQKDIIDFDQQNFF